MEISVEVIDGFRKVARNLANDVISKIPAKPDEHYVHHIHGKAHHRVGHHNNDFAGFPLGENLPDYEIKDGQLLCYCGSHWGVIRFSRFRMREITELKFSSPARSDQHITPVTVKSWVNDSDTPLDYTYKDSKSQSKSESYTSNKELGVEIAYSLTSKVGGGIEGIGEAEIESKYEFKTNFSQRFEKSKTTTTTEEESEELSITVPKMTRTSLIRKKTISDWSQTVKTTGVLDAVIHIGSDGDFGFEFDSLKELENYIRSGGAEKDWMADKYFRERHHQNYGIDLSPLHVTVEDDFTYRDIEVSDLERHDEKLS